ncbi:MAG: 3'(2'),5'-bisphosphate nucleotidase CysQ [Bacteroidia bacterium]|nr:3'(2'),5'-bisphosphate nucleotidase CysQ [Bacteroidia bacterium]
MYKINIDLVIGIAEAAGQAILEVYNSQPGGETVTIAYKPDESPLTMADKAAHTVISSRLNALFPEIPVLSEEGKSVPYVTRKNWKSFWMVDPLDGTREFIKRNGEFTVNIALIEEGKPVLGVIYVPVLNQTFYASLNEGAFMKNASGQVMRMKANPFSETLDNPVIVSSRSHLSAETEAFIARFNNPELISMGSSLKFMLVASGKADVYPRFAPTMEWDTAAAQIIVEEAGGKVVIADTDFPLTYNKENLTNPFFCVTGTSSGQ